MKKDKYFLVIPASGIGQRMNSTIPKQYIILEKGLTIFDQCLNTILSNDLISGFIVALDKKDSHFKSSDFAKDPKLISITTGGKERFHSVLNALNALDQTANTPTIATYQLPGAYDISSKTEIHKVDLYDLDIEDIDGKKEYGQDMGRKSEIKVFDDVDAKKVVVRNQKLYESKTTIFDMKQYKSTSNTSLTLSLIHISEPTRPY